MTDDRPDRRTAPDSPSRDVPADSDVIAGTEEPDPAEVVGEEGDEHDVTSRRLDEPTDAYHRDTLDERLAEEEPEAPLRGQSDAGAGALQAPERGGDDVLRGESDPDVDDDPDDLGAEEAAVHLQPE